MCEISVDVRNVCLATESPEILSEWLGDWVGRLPFGNDIPTVVLSWHFKRGRVVLETAKAIFAERVGQIFFDLVDSSESFFIEDDV